MPQAGRHCAERMQEEARQRGIREEDIICVLDGLTECIVVFTTAIFIATAVPVVAYAVATIAALHPIGLVKTAGHDRHLLFHPRTLASIHGVLVL